MRLKARIISYLTALPDQASSDEKKTILAYLKQHDLAVFPYAFTSRYKPEDITLQYDQERNLLYTMWDGAKLYYKNGTDKRKARKYFNSLRMEQDANSPHCYLTAEFSVSDNDVVLDVGAAEGNFSLSVISRASHIFLFEPEPDWVKALEATFAPWKEKVTIVKNYVSDHTEGNMISIDDYLPEEQRINFIKADVEGFEYALLQGARKTIARQQNLKLAICTYHHQDDADRIDALLKNFGCLTEFTPGYILYHYGRENVVKEPYLRRAVVRARKQG